MTQLAVNCFSYLAATHTLHVEGYPKINYGVEVQSTDRFMAGDGPLVAGMLAAFGHEATLFTNAVADDPDGQVITQRLRHWDVRHRTGPAAAAHTRVNTVVADRAGNRTWFSGLKDVTTELTGIDSAAFASAATAYLDCYEVLGDTPRPLLAAALTANRDVIVNLGGSPPPPWLSQTTAQRGRIGVLQTNADEHDHEDADRTLRELLALDAAELVLVTVGRNGAIGQSRDSSLFKVPALPVAVRQVQGAGSAFSAALIHGRGRVMTDREAAALACRAGSLWCGRSPHGRLPTLDDLQQGEPS